MTNSEINKYLRRIKDARSLCKNVMQDEKSSQDEKEEMEFFEDTLLSLIEKMCNYTRCVFDDNFKNATRNTMMKDANSINDYQRKMEEIERERKSSHDTLIITIRIVDSFCERLGIEPIYGELPEQYKKDTTGLMGEENRSKPGVVETRHAIADWAFDLVCGATIAEYMDLKDYNKSFESYQSLAKGVKSNRNMKNMIEEMTNPDL